MKRVPRHRFVPEGVRREAYADRPLPIGHGQTISQPAVVAAMTELVAPQPSDKCLEIGTGSGYQAAVLAELCAKVYSIEYLAPLASFAEQNLRGSGYGAERVALRTGDGYRGWPERAPFAKIIVTAAPDEVPQALVDQLAVGGTLVLPVGPRDGAQELRILKKTERGVVSERSLPVRFVPMVKPPPQ
jgi:protein-L-isoaspartate(D-aspartate) O-methyltransferase